ncbi:MAG: LacI family DNA-binding transcriptional regulator, partial [Spirochaetales bacterium]|nr:LacI family DNA-binding transcriptional regulator [Spirochaetales bacterium]
MSKNFTLKEIATQLGISISTISKVLNDRPGISNKTKERIINAIKEYNYIPNASARSLVTSKTKIIATVGKKREPRMSSEDYYHRSLVG